MKSKKLEYLKLYVKELSKEWGTFIQKDKLATQIKEDIKKLQDEMSNLPNK